MDLDGYTGRPANARIAVDLDRDAFWDKVIGAITRLSVC